MKTVYDLDGTLVDTKQAVIEAYRVVGCIMPPEAWGRPWQEWLDDASIHQQKNEYYPLMLQQHAKALPLLEHALTKRIPIITGASRLAVEAIKTWIGDRGQRLNIVHHSLTRQQKVDWLAKHGYGVYVDDDEETRQLVKEMTTWDVLSPEEAVFLL